MEWLILILLLLILILERRTKMQALKRFTVDIVGPDGAFYTVARGKNANTAAAMLCDIKYRVAVLMRHVCLRLKDNSVGDSLSGPARLMLDRINNKKIVFIELVPEFGTPVAINYGKGDSIHLCLFDPSNNKPSSRHAIMTVIVHELAHMMDSKTGVIKNGHSLHTSDYKLYEKYLFEQAIELGFIPDAGMVGTPYCGILLPDPDTSTER
jgi:hypothetical protein